jgi:capsule biosynthesis phosphatase
MLRRAANCQPRLDLRKTTMIDSSKTIVFDCDGVIAKTRDDGDYTKAEPLLHGIEQINEIYDMGYKVILFTARYGDREDQCAQRIYGRGYIELVNWLDKHGVKYHEVWMGKPAAMLYVDDKAARVDGDDSAGWKHVWESLEKAKHSDKYGNRLWGKESIIYWDSFVD